MEQTGLAFVAFVIIAGIFVLFVNKDFLKFVLSIHDLKRAALTTWFMFLFAACSVILYINMTEKMGLILLLLVPFAAFGTLIYYSME